MDIDGLSSGAVDALVAVGALARQQDVFGETNLAIVSTGISWSVNVVISEPMLAVRARLEAAVTKVPKVEWLVRLHSDGWVPDSDCSGVLKQGGDLVYRPGL